MYMYIYLYQENERREKKRKREWPILVMACVVLSSLRFPNLHIDICSQKQTVRHS